MTSRFVFLSRFCRSGPVFSSPPPPPQIAVLREKTRKKLGEKQVSYDCALVVAGGDCCGGARGGDCRRRFVEKGSRTMRGACCSCVSSSCCRAVLQALTISFPRRLLEISLWCASLYSVRAVVCSRRFARGAFADVVVMAVEVPYYSAGCKQLVPANLLVLSWEVSHRASREPTIYDTRALLAEDSGAVALP